MKIGIDGSGAMGIRTGVGNYIYRLIENLKKIDSDDEYLIYLNYFRPGKTSPFNNDYAISKNRIPAKIQRFLQNKLHISIEHFIEDVDIFHGPNYFIPPTKKSKTIVTVHDLTFELYPETMIRNDAAYYKEYVPKSIKEADHVLTISNSTKKDLIERFNINEHKISVTHMAAGSNFTPINDKNKIDIILKKYSLPSSFMLTVSTLEPRKNLLTLVRTLERLKKRDQFKQKLVVVGSKGWKNDELFTLINNLGVEEDIIFPGYIGPEDLPALYNACSLFLFPSLYEGFGIPPLEALNCGCACLCSNSSSLPEVVGEGAILIDPQDSELWAEKIEELANDEQLKNEIIDKGLEQAKKFSWEKTARQTLEVYKKVHSA